MQGLDPGAPEIWDICHVKALGPQIGVLASSSRMVPHDMFGGNFVVLPPADVLMPHAENQGSRKQGLKAEAKVLGVSAAARVDGLSVGARPQRGQSPGCSGGWGLGAPRPPRSFPWQPGTSYLCVPHSMGNVELSSFMKLCFLNSFEMNDSGRQYDIFAHTLYWVCSKFC